MGVYFFNWNKCNFVLCLDDQRGLYYKSLTIKKRFLRFRKIEILFILAYSWDVKEKRLEKTTTPPTFLDFSAKPYEGLDKLNERA